MNKKTLTKLEYHKIIDILIEQATSFGGKERCKRLKPMTSITDIEAAQEQTTAAFTRIIKKGRPSFGSCNRGILKASGSRCRARKRRAFAYL